QIKGTGKSGEITLIDLNENKQATNEIKQKDTKIQTNNQTSDLLATPSTRRLARELGVDITKIKGSGRNGMILKEDLDKKEQIQNSTESEVKSDADFINYSGVRKII